MLGHGLAVQSMREVFPEGHYGITLNLLPVDPATSDPADVDAARRGDATSNRIFLDPILRGSYPEDPVVDVASVLDQSHVQDGDLEVISAPLDFLGVNYYTRAVVRAGKPAEGPTEFVGSEFVERVDRGLPRVSRVSRSRRGSIAAARRFDSRGASPAGVR